MSIADLGRHQGTGSVDSREEIPTTPGHSTCPTTDRDTSYKRSGTAIPDGQTTKTTSTADTNVELGDVTIGISGSREKPDIDATHPVARDSIAGGKEDRMEVIPGVKVPPEQTSGKSSASEVKGGDGAAAVAGVVKVDCSAGLVLTSVGRDLVVEAGLMERLGRLVCEGALIEVVDVHKEVSAMCCSIYYRLHLKLCIDGCHRCVDHIISCFGLYLLDRANVHDGRGNATVLLGPLGMKCGDGQAAADFVVGHYDTFVSIC